MLPGGKALPFAPAPLSVRTLQALGLIRWLALTPDRAGEPSFPATADAADADKCSSFRKPR